MLIAVLFYAEILTFHSSYMCASFYQTKIDTGRHFVFTLCTLISMAILSVAHGRIDKMNDERCPIAFK